MVLLSRRQFCAAPAFLALPAFPAADQSGILVTAAQAAKLRTDALPPALRRQATAALQAGPWSVTAERPDNVSASPNDYYSEGPYWWPDPKNPKGPYIRKDGERNPRRFQANRRDLGDMCSSVLALSMGAYLLEDRACGNHAARVLTTWFLDPKTRMNPNLEFGQAVRGISTGRGTGLIDTISLIHAAQGIWLLEQAAMLESTVRDGVHQWYADFLTWMTTSSKGLDEKKSGNNHATWWTAQVAAYAALTGNAAAKKMAWEHYRAYLVPEEIRPDGSCPLEEARTDSLSYSSMNLDAFAVLCRIAATNNVELWEFATAKGVGVRQAFDYLLPFVVHPQNWKKQQMSKFSTDSTVWPGLAGAAIHSPQLLEAYRALPRGNSPWVQFVDLVV